MKRTAGKFPSEPSLPARYNVELPTEKAYVSGVITLQMKPAVHVRIGDYTHVINADSAIGLAEAIIEQAGYARKIVDVWIGLLKKAKEEASTAQTEIDCDPKEPTP